MYRNSGELHPTSMFRRTLNPSKQILGLDGRLVDNRVDYVPEELREVCGPNSSEILRKLKGRTTVFF